MHIRRAVLSDISRLIAIKQALPMPAEEHSTRGGFLLGVDPEGYALQIAHGHVEVFCLDEEILAFCTTVPDALLRQSDIWKRRHEVDWEGVALEAIEKDKICYVDQLAGLPRHVVRIGAAALGLRTAIHHFKDHAHLVTTTVVWPTANKAALPFLRRAGARKVGEIQENYPIVGKITSAIYHLERLVFEENLLKFERSRSVAAAKTMRLVRCGHERD